MPPTPSVLIVDDEPDLIELVSLTLGRMNLATASASDLAGARALLAAQRFALCLTDMKLPDGDGLDLVAHIQDRSSEPPVAVITAHGNVESAVRALKLGAFDFVSKPLDLGVLRKLVAKAIKLADRSGPNAPSPAHGPRLLGHSAAMAAESELFGHKRGSFTGAIADKRGLVQSAEGGTLFLDEVADLPLHMQVKLLRLIQEKTVRPIGEQREVPVDVRVLSATHKSLSELVAQGRFREDLFYRINVIEIRVPALREHAEDIPELADTMLQRLSARIGARLPCMTEPARAALQRYAFPGNVRELENILERAIALSASGVIDLEDLQLRQPAAATVAAEPARLDGAARSPQLADASARTALGDQLENIERAAIVKALEQTRYNKTAAAKLLGMSFRALRYRVKKLGIE